MQHVNRSHKLRLFKECESKWNDPSNRPVNDPDFCKFCNKPMSLIFTNFAEGKKVLEMAVPKKA